MHHEKRCFTLLLVLAMLLSCLPAPAAAVTFSKLLEAANDRGSIVLQQPVTEALTVEQDVCIDLNGYNITGAVTVAEGCTLYVKDSRTDDYTVMDGEGYGRISGYSGNVMPADGYLKLDGEGGASFHRVDMGITSMSLRTACAGIYYTGSFYGDELVAENVKAFGIALRISQAPDADYMRTTSAYSRYEVFVPGDLGNEATGTLLSGVMKTQNTATVNDRQAKWKIWGCPYILTEDGTYTFGQTVSRSLMEQVQAADAMWAKLTAAQRSELKAMCRVYSGVMDNWYLPHIFNTDIDVPI